MNMTSISSSKVNISISIYLYIYIYIYIYITVTKQPGHFHEGIRCYTRIRIELYLLFSEL